MAGLAFAEGWRLWAPTRRVAVINFLLHRCNIERSGIIIGHTYDLHNGWDILSTSTYTFLELTAFIADTCVTIPMTLPKHTEVTRHGHIEQVPETSGSQHVA